MNKNLFRTLIAGVLVLALLFTGFNGLKAVFAQTATPGTPATPATPAKPSKSDKEVLPGNGYMGTSDENLATILGKTAAEMQAARKAAFVLAVDQALANGDLTQAQATKLKANNGNGYGLLLKLIGNVGFSKLDEQALFATALGISVEKLNAAYAQICTNRLAALVTNGQLTQAEADEIASHLALQQSTAFQAEVKAAITTAINNAVKAGTITQAQANALIAKLQSANGRGTGFGGFDGIQGGMMNGKGMMGQSMFGQGMFGQGCQGLFNQDGQGMYGQGGQGRYNEKDFNGQGMQGKYNPGKGN